MKRMILVLALLMTLPVWASEANSYSGDITAAGTTCSTTNACIVANLDRADSFAVVQITGTFTATVQFEATVNGSTFVSISGTPSGGGSAVTSATAAGAWRFTVSGYKSLRVRASAYTSGTATVKISVSNAASSVASSSALPDAGSDGACLVSASGEWVRGDCSGDPATQAWGGITGTLSAQTDLQTALDAKVPVTRTVNGQAPSGNVTITTITGNAGTATALAANGANCSAGQAPLGVDASGAVEGCFTPSGALPAGVSSDGANGLAVTGKVAAASVETTGSAAYVQIPDGGTAGANKFTSAAGVVKWGTLAVTQTIAKGSLALATNSIASGSCQTVTQGSVNSAAATGVLTTDVINFTANGSIKAVTGYVPATTGGLTIAAYPTAGYVNFDVCNWTSGAVVPGAVTINWQVTR